MSRSKTRDRPRSILRRCSVLFLKVLLILVLLSVLEVLILRVVNPPFTVSGAFGWIEGRIRSSPHELPRYRWRDLETISPHLVRAVLAAEDQRFLSHHGFDFIEMNEAVRDILSDRRFRGASTITMQVARTVFLWPARSWLRKAAEAYYTVLIELLWSKKRILEIYLNTVDWGTGVMGADAASRKYYRIGADRIGPLQAAALAAVLPNPHLWSPTKPSGQVRERRQRILRDMKNMPSF